jgi:hypothetical protein
MTQNWSLTDKTRAPVLGRPTVLRAKFRDRSGVLSAAQDCTAAAQGCLLIAQFKTAAAQVRNRKWNLVRSFFVCDGGN